MNKDLLHVAVQAARGAGKHVLEYYKIPDSGVRYKDDDSPVTKADLAAESFIRESLKGTGIPVISEESPVDYPVRNSWQQFWLVDPLDGTKDFLDGNDEFSINIALIEHNVPVLGVLYCPAVDELYFGCRGQGSWLEKDGTRRKLPLRVPVAGGFVPLIAVESRKHRSALGARFLEMNSVDTIIPMGSARKFAVVARGDATLYPRFEGSMEWDIAAGHVIATEAGCSIIDISTGDAPVYNKISQKNNFFIVIFPGVSISDLKFPNMQQGRIF